MKKYVSDVIGKDYLKWKNGKVFINFPTGCGKSHFILNVFLPYLQAVGKRALILCNRKLLRQQYWYDAVKRFTNYTELKSVATIDTYQGLYQQLFNNDKILDEFDVVILDEYHYFLADAQFNGAGTYILAQIIADKCLRRLMIFMTATPNEVEPLFDNLLATCYKYKLKSCQPGFDYSPLAKCFSYGDPMAIDSSRFKCYAVPDEESLLEKIADSEGKSVLFIDNRYKAEQWRKSLMKNNKFEGKDIMLLNSENLEENSEFVARLSIANVVDSRILITTSVLDNGVTIHDPEVKNLVIITESQTSFLQMLGRLRSESSEEVNLYFLIRDADFFQERMLGVKTDLERIEDIKNAQNSLDSFLIASTVWNNPTDKLAEFYRRYLVVT